MMKKFAVIVAGGSGLRMGTSIPKQFLQIRQKPLLWYSIKAFLDAYTDMQIVLVLPNAFLDDGYTLAKELNALDRIQITAGGETRFHSVQNGLKLVTDPSIVFVHDGVRCLITTELIQRCYEQALGKGSAIPAVTATDSIRMTDEEHHFVLNRSHVKIIQTPQTFQSNLILPAFEQPYDENFTDEATVIEASGETVYLVEGDHQNIKVTRPVDLLIAEQILSERD